jgi:uncharacterized coiled-coil protein SlyX
MYTPEEMLSDANARITDLESKAVAQALRIVELERQCKEWERRTWDALDKLHTAIDVKIGARCLHGVWIADHCWTCGEPKSVSLMGR